MRVLRLGIDHATGKLLYPALEEQVLAQALRQGVARNLARLRSESEAVSQAVAFRGEVQPQPTVNLADPRAAGWTYLVAEDDPRRSEIASIMKPLALYRGMDDCDRPLVLAKNADWWIWQDDEYRGLDLQGRKVPHYVLIVGGPDLVPFGFQSALAVTASVGRVAFEDLESLQTYVDKVIRLETAPNPAPSREVLFFATDGGPYDPTHFSRRYMVEPLAEHVETKLACPVHKLLGPDATKERLLADLASRKPALVYTASHGLGPPQGDLVLQKLVTGALCCQPDRSVAIESWTITAADIPATGPFLEGAIFFQFACFGYGTPAISDYAHWLPESAGVSARLAEADILSALPQKLLANPRGPVAYVGHLDTAWLHGFGDPEEPYPLERWNARIFPFKAAVESFLRVRPPGLAMTPMNERFSTSNSQLTDLFDQLQAGRALMDNRLSARLSDAFIFRSDARNYMILGDPAARPRMPDP